MSYRPLTRPVGDLNSLPAVQYDGNLETLQGVIRLADAMISELYDLITVGGVIVGGAALVTDAAPGSGSITSYSPTGFGTDTDRLDIQANNADTTINDLPAGIDGQRLRIRNTGATGTLNLTNANSGSTAAKRFSGASDVGILPGDSVDVIYYGGSVARWVM